MKFLALEILAYLVAASVLGIIIGWMTRSARAIKQTAGVESEWNTRYSELQTRSGAEITTLNDRADSLEKQVTTLRNRLQALNVEKDSHSTELAEARAQSRSLNEVVLSHQESLQQAASENKRLLTELDSAQRSLDVAIAEKNTQIETMKEQIQALKSQPETIASATASLENSAQLDDTILDEQLKELQSQQAELEAEREAVAQREAVLSSQLMFGDDTQAYFDETVKVEPAINEILAARIADNARRNGTTSITGQTHDTDDTLVIESVDATQTARVDSEETDATGNSVLNTTFSESMDETLPAELADTVDDEQEPRSLWQKVRHSVSRTREKA